MTVICMPGVGQVHDFAWGTAAPDSVVETALGAIRLSIFRDIQLAENVWQTLQSITPGVPQHSYEWVKAWTRSAARDSSIDAAIVCGRSQTGEILFVWPFEVATRKGLRCLQWIGQGDANHNMGLNRLKFSRDVTARDVKALLCKAAEIIGDVSAAHFINQPVEWNGIPNPLKLLASHPSAAQGNMLLLDSDFGTLYRNRFSGKARNALARKARKLDKLGVVKFGWARSPEERSELLKLFFEPKSGVSTGQDLHNPFEGAERGSSFHDLTGYGRPEQNASLETAYIKIDGHPVAISSGIFYADSFSQLLTSHDEGPASEYALCTLLLHFQIEEACRQGLHFFDMGAGDATSKSAWCDVDMPLFDSAIAFEEHGYLVTLPLMAGAAFSRAIKRHPEIWASVKATRKMVFRRRDYSFNSSQVLASIQR